ncbi:XRE family transcriptional regulator [archaeon]|nr:XRE family transcriptional regulator [archaeon]
MFEDLSQIKLLRRHLGVSQKDLAITAGVSQSLIAKIEAGNLEPTYSKVRAIFSALDDLRGRTEPNVASFMHKKILFAKPSEKLSQVVALMKKKGISQIPVMGCGGVIGIITESCVLNAIAERGSEFSSLRAEDVMEECPPIVSARTGQKMILELLKEYQLVLVADHGEIVGLVSKADLLTVF